MSEFYLRSSDESVCQKQTTIRRMNTYQIILSVLVAYQIDIIYGNALVEKPQ